MELGFYNLYAYDEKSYSYNIYYIPLADFKEKNDLPPNILFIMTDDHALKTKSAYDSAFITTPNIDRIANEGVKFNQAFVTNSICAPRRNAYG